MSRSLCGLASAGLCKTLTARAYRPSSLERHLWQLRLLAVDYRGVISTAMTKAWEAPSHCTSYTGLRITRACFNQVISCQRCSRRSRSLVCCTRLGTHSLLRFHLASLRPCCSRWVHDFAALAHYDLLKLHSMLSSGGSFQNCHYYGTNYSFQVFSIKLMKLNFFI